MHLPAFLALAAAQALLLRLVRVPAHRCAHGARNSLRQRVHSPVAARAAAGLEDADGAAVEHREEPQEGERISAKFSASSAAKWATLPMPVPTRTVPDSVASAGSGVETDVYSIQTEISYSQTTWVPGIGMRRRMRLGSRLEIFDCSVRIEARRPVARCYECQLVHMSDSTAIVPAVDHFRGGDSSSFSGGTTSSTASGSGSAMTSGASLPTGGSIGIVSTALCVSEDVPLT